MELTTTQSTPTQIQPTIQRFVRMLASVLQLEVEIVNRNLCRITGTGAYGKFLGRQLNGSSRLLHHVLKTKTEKAVTQSCFDPLYGGRDNKESYREKAFLGIPVILQERCIRMMSLIAVAHEQREHISDNLRGFSDCIRHISTISVFKLLEDQGPGDNISGISTAMIDSMDQGMLMVDADNRARFVNQTALKTLGVIQSNIIGKPAHFRPLTFESGFIHGHMQHIVSWDDKGELIISQLHSTRD